MERGRIVESRHHEDLLASKGLMPMCGNRWGRAERSYSTCVTDGTAEDLFLSSPANLIEHRNNSAHLSQILVHSGAFAHETV